MKQSEAEIADKNTFHIRRWCCFTANPFWLIPTVLIHTIYKHCKSIASLRNATSSKNGIQGFLLASAFCIWTLNKMNLLKVRSYCSVSISWKQTEMKVALCCLTYLWIMVLFGKLCAIIPWPGHLWAKHILLSGPTFLKTQDKKVPFSQERNSRGHYGIVCVFTAADPSLWSLQFLRLHEVFEVWLGTITAFGKAHIDEMFEARKTK